MIIAAVTTIVAVAFFLRRIGPRSRLIFAVLAAAFVVTLTLFIRHISVPRVIGRALAPDGTEMCLVQRCNWSGEPFTTSFYSRKPGAPWNWFYYDHQDVYWDSSPVVLDTNTQVATFYRGKSTAVTFNWSTETYQRGSNTMTGTPSQMPVGWNPQLPVP